MRLLLADYERAVNITTETPTLDQARWTFINAMFFCCSLYTSIGFGGRLYPKTSAGRIVTMLYSFIGIPFMLAMTSDLGLVIFDGMLLTIAQFKVHSNLLLLVVD